MKGAGGWKRASQKAGRHPNPLWQRRSYEAGWIALFQGDYDRAIALLEEALALFRELGDRQGVATSLVNLGFAATTPGRQRARGRATPGGRGVARESPWTGLRSLG